MTAVAQPPPGPQRAVVTTAPRAPASVRRTTTIDVTWPDGLRGPTVVVLSGQDLATDAAGRASVVERVSLSLGIDPRTGVISSGLDELVGRNARSGFGRLVATVFADEAEARSLRYSLLEDLPGAFLVSGYAPLRAGLLGGDSDLLKERGRAQADICAGWATGSPIQVALADHGHTAVPVGPEAPPIEAAEPEGWHPLAPLTLDTVRRRRLLDVSRPGEDGTLRAEAHFRDSHAGEEREMVMHEYAVAATFDERDRVAAIDVDPRVLPWAECPAAVASAAQVVGIGVDDLARAARTDLVGPTTCTHLTSTIRSLVDVRALAGSIPDG